MNFGNIVKVPKFPWVKQMKLRIPLFRKIPVENKIQPKQNRFEIIEIQIISVLFQFSGTLGGFFIPELFSY